MADIRAEIDIKLNLLESIDKVKDLNTLKDILKTHILTKSTNIWDKETTNAFNNDQISSDVDQNIKLISLCINSVRNNIPSRICQLIAEFAQKYINIKIESKTSDKIYVDEDAYLNDRIVIPPQLHNEQTITLNHPILLGNNQCPFQISFDISFPGVSVGNKHGGIFFGHTNKNGSRWLGAKGINGTSWKEAKCTVIDWIAPEGFRTYKNHHGFRIYGTEQHVWTFDEWKSVEDVPRKWRIVFYKDNKCEFFANNKKVHSFVCYSISGYIGFWSCGSSKCGIVVENLDIVKL
eukprot:386013_1